MYNKQSSAAPLLVNIFKPESTHTVKLLYCRYHYHNGGMTNKEIFTAYRVLKQL